MKLAQLLRPSELALDEHALDLRLGAGGHLHGRLCMCMDGGRLLGTRRLASALALVGVEGLNGGADGL